MTPTTESILERVQSFKGQLDELLGMLKMLEANEKTRALERALDQINEHAEGAGRALQELADRHPLVDGLEAELRPVVETMAEVQRLSGEAKASLREIGGESSEVLKIAQKLVEKYVPMCDEIVSGSKIAASFWSRFRKTRSPKAG